MRYNEIKGNLFKLDKKYSLAHCISLDCAMGKGIAINFNKNFKGMKSFLKNKIKKDCINSPTTILYFEDNKSPIFNLITKKKYWHKPTYKTITECIKQMVKQCQRYNIKYLAMPKIGCGLDRLQWCKVRKIIQDNFKNLDIEIEIRYL